MYNNNAICVQQNDGNSMYVHQYVQHCRGDTR